MINTDDFIKSLELIFDFYGHTSSSFADKIGVQRSSLSHLLSGRNKPSLDLILKIIAVFPEVDFYWLVFGEGNFPKNSSSENLKTNEVLNVNSPTLPFNNEEIETKNSTAASSNIMSEKGENIKIEEIKIEGKNLERIVLFYSDGSFKEYIP